MNVGEEMITDVGEREESAILELKNFNEGLNYSVENQRKIKWDED